MRLFSVFALLLCCSATCVYALKPKTESASSICREFNLPELKVTSSQKKVLHILGLVREESTLTSFSDTVFLYREKVVDFVVPNIGGKYTGWLNPRVIASKSYYRFTADDGTDSVSDNYVRHFSWSDLVGIVREDSLPKGFLRHGTATDTVMGRYNAARVLNKDSADVTLSFDVLTDLSARRKFPLISRYVDDDNLDFRHLNVRYQYEGVTTERLIPENLTVMRIDIESKGRGGDEMPVYKTKNTGYVDTHAIMYVIGREYITTKEAEKWRKNTLNWDDLSEYLNQAIPQRDPAINKLIARVENTNRTKIRVELEPDRRLASRHILSGKNNFTILNRLKFMLRQLIPIPYKKPEIKAAPPAPRRRF